MQKAYPSDDAIAAEPINKSDQSQRVDLDFARCVCQLYEIAKCLAAEVL